MSKPGTIQERPASSEVAECVHLLFERQAAATPEGLAVVGGDESLTYGRLNEQANQVAHYLMELGVKRGDRVGLSLDRGCRMVVALLGILKSGAAYVPLDPAYPAGRLRFMLSDAGLGVVVAQERTGAAMMGEGRRVICLDEEWARVEGQPVVNPEAGSGRDDLAYVIYTSGSTGEPKGVMIRHGSLVNHSRAVTEAYGLKAADRVLQFASISFDVAGEEIYPALLSGASVVLRSEEVLDSCQGFSAFVEEQGVTVLNLPVSYWQVWVAEMVRRGGRVPLPVRVMVVGNEKVSVEAYRAWHRLAGSRVAWWNAYGPTEATITATLYQPPSVEAIAGLSSVPIGRPIRNVTVRLLDGAGLPVGLGEEGEIYLGGAGLAAGYLNREALTADRFVEVMGERMYRTGDRARELPDGNLVFVGRVDEQVKVRGYRVEPGEIEAVLNRHPSISQSVVVGREDAQGRTVLAAYVVPKLEETVPELWPSVGDYQIFDEVMYYAMTYDALRDAQFEAAFDRLVPGKVVLEVGTGQDALLARMMVAAGARRVYAIERQGVACERARELVERFGLERSIIVMEGEPGQIELPEQVDVCASELIGTVGSSEGVAGALNDARRFLKQDGIMIPWRCVTRIAGVTLPGALAAAPAFSALPAHYAGRIFAEAGRRFDLRVVIKHFPVDHLLTGDGVFEDLDFQRVIDPEGSRAVALRAHRDGRLDGFLLWLNLHPAEGLLIDTLGGDYSWLPVYFPAFDPPVDLREGDVIEAECRRVVPGGIRRPDYLITGRIRRRDGGEVPFVYESALHQRTAGGNRFYGRLLAGDPVSVTPARAPQVSAGMMRAHLRGLLPEYMVPTAYGVLEAFPMLPSGKVDRAGLPELGPVREETSVVGRTPTEELLAVVWGEVLGLESVGPGDNFFSLGGHSLHATQVMSRVRDLFEVEMPLRVIFEESTVAGLAREIERRQGEARGLAGPALRPVARRDLLPLSFAQQRLWFLDRLLPGGSIYNMPEGLRVTGLLDVKVLEGSLNEIRRRHEVLRTVVEERDGRPWQVVRAWSPEPLRQVDLRGVPEGEREAHLQRLWREEARRPFDLRRGPTVRAVLWRLGEVEWFLGLTLHHIASDAWSVALMFDELALHYRRLKPGQGEVPEDLPLQYADFAVWQRDWLGSGVLEGQLEYWRTQLAGQAPLLELPWDRPRPKAQTYEGASCSILIPARLCARLVSLGHERRSTLYMVLLAAFQTLLHRYTGETDIPVGTPIAGRNRAEIETLIGFFVNTLVMRSDLSGDPTFLELLERVREVALGAYAHQDVPFEKLVEELQPGRDPGHSPLFQVMFALQNAIGARQEVESVSFVPEKSGEAGALFDLTLELSEEAGGLRAEFIYNIELFESATIARWLENYRTLLESLVAEPGRHLSELRLVSKRERAVIEDYSSRALAQDSVGGMLNAGRVAGSGIRVRILDSHGEAVPLGAVGEVFLEGAPGDAALRRTRLLARWTGEGRMEFAGAVGRRVRLKGRWIDLGSMEAELMREPGVLDCAVVPRDLVAGGTVLVAYVVGRFSRERTEERLLARFHAVPSCFVGVYRLPLTTSGRVDHEALKRLEVLDEEIRWGWENHLSRLPSVNEAAVVLGPPAPRCSCSHLLELVPGWVEIPERRPVAQAAVEADAEKGVAAESSGRAEVDAGPLVLAPGTPASLPGLLKRAALGVGGVVYIRSDGSVVEQSYGELMAAAERVLGGLRRLGLKAGDKVILHFSETPDAILAFWGCALGGMVPVPIGSARSYDPSSPVVKKLQGAWEALDRPVVLSSDEVVPLLRSLADRLELRQFNAVPLSELSAAPRAADWHECEGGETALLLSTSGSTGVSKLVMLGHRQLIARSAGSAQLNEFSAYDVTLNWMPFEHAAGVVFFHLRDVYLGCRQLHVANSHILEDPVRWLDLLERFKVTVTFAPNFAFALLNECEVRIRRGSWNLSRVRYVLNGAEPIVARTARKFLQLLAPHRLVRTAMRPAWGMAETTSGVTYGRHFTLDSTSDSDPCVEVGEPIPGVALRIVNDENEVVTEGTVGHLQVRGPQVMRGYYGRDPAESFTAEGWLITGDLGWIRGGQLTISGREKDVIIVNGVNYSGTEIEAEVGSIEGVDVASVAACGVRAGGTGEDQPAIFFHPSCSGDKALRELLRAIRGRVSSEVGVTPAYLVPLPAEGIPRTAVGKIQRGLLKQRFEAGDFDAVIRRTDLLLRNSRTLPDWFYRREWCHRELPPPTEPLKAATSVVFCDDAGIGVAVCGALPGRVVRVGKGRSFVRENAAWYRINPADPGHHRRLLESLAGEGLDVSQVIHLWTCGSADTSDAEGLEREQARGALSLVKLVQAWKDRHGEKPLRLLVASTESQSVLPEEAVDPAKAPLIATLMVMRQELAWLRCSHVDLGGCGGRIDEGGGGGEGEGGELDDGQRLLAELRSPGREDEVAYRDGRRFVPVLKPVDPRTSCVRPIPFRAGGFYLVSGGLGAVGFEVVKMLLVRYGAHVLVLGRTPVEGPEGAVGGEDPRWERLEQCRALAVGKGAIEYAGVDVCEAELVRRAVAAVSARWGMRLDGVVHLAGRVEERSVLEESGDGLRALLRPKAVGAWVLHELTRDLPEALFVCFGSVNAFFGGVRFAGYAGANRFLAEFVRHRLSRGYRHTYCLNWSMWSDLGMNRGYAYRETSQQQGFEAMTVVQGVASMLAALRMEPGNILIGLDGTRPFLRQRVEAEPLAVEHLHGYLVGEENEVALEAGGFVLRDRFGVRTECSVQFLKHLSAAARGEEGEAGRGAMRPAPPAIPPATEMEKALARIWEELLGVSGVGIHDNFFELGGHSLLATQLASRIRDRFDAELALQKLFEFPTIAGLAGCLQEVVPEPARRMPASMKQIAREGVFPISFSQERLWFFDRLIPDSPSYNIPQAIRLRGRLDTVALERSFDEMIRRHETLRTTFGVVDSVPRQVIAREGAVELGLMDLSHLHGQVAEEEAIRVAIEEAGKPFDLTLGPLLRVGLVRLREEEHVLLITMHHIISDGWSQGVFLRELTALYEALGQGRPSPLPELTIQYADFSQWQLDYMQGEALREQLDYWLGRLEGYPQALELPVDRPHPLRPSFRGGTERFVVPLRLSQQLNALSQNSGVTPFMTLLAAFKTLLQRYSGMDDIVVGTPIAGRNRLETEGLIGFFANTLVMRTDLSGDPLFSELLNRVQETALGAYAHQDLPFEKLVEAVNPRRDLRRQPLFQVMFVLQNAPAEDLRLSGLDLTPIHVDPGVALFDLTLYLEAAPGGLIGSMEYNSDVFDAETVRRLVRHYLVLLDGIVTQPGRPISQLPLFSGFERRQIVEEWNETSSPYPRGKCIHELFQEQAARNPRAVAVEFEGERISYEELNCRANRLAHRLRKCGVGPEEVVAVYLERSPALVMALLGILKAGGAYLALAVDYPPERLSFMMKETGARVVLTTQALLSRLPASSARALLLDSDNEALVHESTINPANHCQSEQLAYVCYTSGSTGRPKGVQVVHRGVVRLVRETNYVTLDPAEVLLQMAPVSFDASTFEIWGALLNGGRLVVMPPGGVDLEQLGRVIREHRVTTLWLTADLFHLMVDERLQDLKGVRQLLAGGDVLSVSHVNKALAELPGVTLINGYGPTESTTFAICHPMAGRDRFERSVPLGRPISNTTVYILDSALQPVPVGVAGEICLGGDGLARGYLNRPETTGERFVPDSFTGRGRLYRTGDYGRYRSDGVIEFIGRRDDQVKIRGFRIELREVERAMEQADGVASAVVVAEEGAGSGKRLVGYYVSRDGSSVTGQRVREELGRLLPDYMVPGVVVEVEAWPLSPSGKVDRGALPAPGSEGVEADGAPSEPSDLIEACLKQIWERVLGLRSIGVRDNFFALGGHSLMAVRLFVEIEKVTGEKLPLATLFQAPTVEQLAAVMRRDGWEPPWSSLVAIQPAGSKPPLFIIHGVGGNVLNFHALADYLDEDQPVYGLQSRGLDGKEAPPTRIEEMATHYLEEIRSVQPVGPYYMGGMSFGGVVAFEMAQQLRARGETVGLLALLDSYPLGYSELTPITGRAQRNIQSWAARVRGHWSRLAALSWIEKGRYVRRKLRTIHRRARSWFLFRFHRHRALSTGEGTDGLQNVKEANYLAASEYVTKPYPGGVTLFLASEQSLGETFDPATVWKELALGGVRAFEIPGDHVTLIEEPHVQELASILQKVLDEAVRNSGAGAAGEGQVRPEGL